MKFKYLICAIAVILSVSSYVSDVHGETLVDTINAAKIYDSVYLAAIAQHESILTKKSQALAELLPRLSAYGNANWNDRNTSYDNDDQTTFSRTFNTQGYGVQLTQPVFQMGSFASYSQSKCFIIQSMAQLAQAENELILRTAQAYYDLLIAKDVLENIRAQKSAIKEQLAAAEKGFEIGASSITDVKESEAKFGLIEAQKIEAELDIENKRNILHMIAGPDIGDPQPVCGNPQLSESENMPPLIAKVENNATVLAAKAALEASEKEISKSKAGYYPTLDLVASYSDNSQGPDANNPNSVNVRVRNTSAGIQIQVPLFSGGSTIAKVRESVKLRDKAKEELKNARRQIALQIRQAFTGVVSGTVQIKALEAGVASSELALKSNNLGFTYGMRTSIDVLNAQQQLYSAMTDLNKARYNAWMQRLKLGLLVGDTRIINPVANRTDSANVHSETHRQYSNSKLSAVMAGGLQSK
jgi:outer membrane protein